MQGLDIALKVDGLGIFFAVLRQTYNTRYKGTTFDESTECLKWRPLLRQMRESMLRQTLHVRVASDTQKIKSSEWPTWLCVKKFATIFQAKCHFRWPDKWAVDASIGWTGIFCCCRRALVLQFWHTWRVRYICCLCCWHRLTHCVPRLWASWHCKRTGT